MEHSPLQLTPEQQRAYEDKLTKAFLLDIGEVEKKHNRRLAASTDFHPLKGIYPKMIVLEIKPEEPLNHNIEE